MLVFIKAELQENYIKMGSGENGFEAGKEDGHALFFIFLPVRLSRSFSSKEDRVSSSPSNDVSLSEFWFPRAWLLMDCFPLRISSSDARRGGGGLSYLTYHAEYSKVANTLYLTKHTHTHRFGFIAKLYGIQTSFEADSLYKINLVLIIFIVYS